MPRNNMLQDAQVAINRVLGRGEAGIADNPVAMDSQMPEVGWAQAQAQEAIPQERNWYAPPPPQPLAVPNGYDPVVYGRAQVREYGDEVKKTKKYVNPDSRITYLTLASKILAGTANKTIEDVIAAAKQIDEYVHGTNDRD